MTSCYGGGDSCNTFCRRETFRGYMQQPIAISRKPIREVWATPKAPLVVLLFVRRITCTSGLPNSFGRGMVSSRNYRVFMVSKDDKTPMSRLRRGTAILWPIAFGLVRCDAWLKRHQGRHFDLPKSSCNDSPLRSSVAQGYATPFFVCLFVCL